eukprot:COSAG02_NODE_34442_length_484_cov_0.805195_1_plen_154_part_01
MQCMTTVIGRFSLKATLTHVSTCCASFYLSANVLAIVPLTTTALLLTRADMPAVFGPSKIDNDYYDVPYKIMLPPRGVGANLLVPVALSASAVAYSSTRIESMFMAVGTAAGVAAQQLVDGSVEAVQDVDVATVQGILVSHFRQQIHVAQHTPA